MKWLRNIGKEVYNNVEITHFAPGEVLAVEDGTYDEFVAERPLIFELLDECPFDISNAEGIAVGTRINPINLELKSTEGEVALGWLPGIGLVDLNAFRDAEVEEEPGESFPESAEYSVGDSRATNLKLQDDEEFGQVEEITEPEITEPEITEPEITEPEITEPGRRGRKRGS